MATPTVTPPAAVPEAASAASEAAQAAQTAASTAAEAAPAAAEAASTAASAAQAAPAAASAATRTAGIHNIDPNLRPEAGTRAERKWIKKERKKLRKALKEKGITSRTDFENIAHDLGLQLDGRSRWFALFWLWASNLLSNLGLKSLLAAAALALAALFALAVISEKAGSFTINLTQDMLYSDFTLSETPGFEEPSVRLIAEEIINVTNINIAEISESVTETDGSQNDQDYFAYTFYIRNDGDVSAGYTYNLTLTSETLGVSDAVWVMLFEDEHQVVYAKESADGNPEEIYGYADPPFADCAYDYDAQYYKEGDRYGMVATNFVDDEIIAQGMVSSVAPGEYKKYTVVIWVEGEDPECTNDIFGGYAGFTMNFDTATPEGGVFSGLYRTEYEF